MRQLHAAEHDALLADREALTVARLRIAELETEVRGLRGRVDELQPLDVREQMGVVGEALRETAERLHILMYGDIKPHRSDVALCIRRAAQELLAVTREAGYHLTITRKAYHPLSQAHLVPEIDVWPNQRAGEPRQ